MAADPEIDELFDEMLRLFHEELEKDLRPFAEAQETFVNELLSAPLPADWRGRLGQQLDGWHARGYEVAPDDRASYADWIAAWAEARGLLPLSEQQALPADSPVRKVVSDGDDRSPGALRPGYVPEWRRSEIPMRVPPPDPPLSPKDPGFAIEAEELVAEEISIARNTPPKQQTIPGSGPRGYRILDFPHRGPDGSIRIRGSIIEVKASGSKNFGALSDRSRQQILDAVNYAEKIREKARIVKDPKLKQFLMNVRVEVFSDLAEPTKGEFAKLTEARILDWKKIPRPLTISAESSGKAASGLVSGGSAPTKPGLGMAENIALGFLTSLVEASVAKTFYRQSASALEDLLQQISGNGEANEDEWREIGEKLTEIATMKQSLMGYAWEFVSFGQGSIAEKRATAMMILASDLAKKYGYRSTKTWGETITGAVDRWEKSR